MRKPKDDTWLLPDQAAQVLGLASADDARTLAAKLGALNTDGPVPWINMHVFRLNSKPKTIVPEKPKGEGRTPDMLAQKIGKLEKSVHTKLPAKMEETRRKRDQERSKLADPDTLPYHRVVADREARKCERELVALGEKRDAHAKELDDLLHLDRYGIEKWFRDHGYPFPVRKDDEEIERELADLEEESRRREAESEHDPDFPNK